MGSPGPHVRAAEPADHDAMADVFLRAARAAWESRYAPDVVSRAYDDVLGLSGDGPPR